ncbi:unnamed protein product [Effrenium voratum]|nr:unnamed protein product [Effrenium voratum]
MLLRLHRMLATTSRMLHSAQVPSEIIVVEWNPVFGAPLMHEEITREPGAESVPIRIIQVPTTVHMSMPHAKAHPIFEHTAENVAFRRAKGKFILKTNIDNILSPDTVLFISRQQLEPFVVYRATYMEYDVTRPETEGLAADALIEWLFSREDLITNMNLEMADLRAKYPEDAAVCMSGHRPEEKDMKRPFYWPGSGDFVLASKQLILAVRGYPEVAQNWQTDDLIHCRLRAFGARQVVLQPPCLTVHQNHQRINRVRSSTRWVITDKNFQEVCDNPFALAEQFEDMRQDQQLLRDFMQSSVDELAEQLLEKNRTLLVYVDQAASAGKNVRQAETSSELDLAAESGTVEAMERQLDVALASLTDLQNSKNALDLEVMEHKSTLADKKSELIQCKVFAANAMDDAKEQIDEDLDEMIESFSSRAAAEAKMETDTAEEFKS